MSETETIRVSRKGFDLYPPTGAPLPVTGVGITMTLDEGSITELRMHFEMAPALWARLDDEQLFGLTEAARGPLFAGGFNPTPDVEVEVRLDTEHLAGLQPFADNIYTVGGKLLPAEDNPLRQTESWKALVIKQQRGPLKTGMKTNH